jgi:hypothetical protein
MASHQAIIVKVWVQFQASSLGIVGGQNGTVTGFSLSLGINPLVFHTNLLICQQQCYLASDIIIKK